MVGSIFTKFLTCRSMFKSDRSLYTRSRRMAWNADFPNLCQRSHDHTFHIYVSCAITRLQNIQSASRIRIHFDSPLCPVHMRSSTNSVLCFCSWEVCSPQLSWVSTKLTHKFFPKSFLSTPPTSFRAQSCALLSMQVDTYMSPHKIPTGLIFIYSIYTHCPFFVSLFLCSENQTYMQIYMWI